MPGFDSMRWPVLVICGALAMAGCATDTQGESGSLALDLVINGGTDIDEVRWVITRGDEEIKSGAINTSANGATASVEAYGLPPGDGYTIMLEAMSADGETTCKGETTFDIAIGQVTEVHVMMNCKLPPRFGGVRVDGEFNICPYLTWADASPLVTSVGNDIDLSAMATDDEGDAITYMWSSGSGMIANPMAASTTYTCTAAGPDVITILVTDDGGTYCMDMHDFAVTCVAGDGNPCDGVTCDDTGNECTVAACNPATGMCETSNVADGTDCNDATGMCMGGTCVDKDLCMDVVCDDTGNECTAAMCNPATGMCETSNVTDGTSCGDGGACMGGTCIEGDLCEGVTCDDTMNECTIAACNSQTGMCDVMNVMDGTACLDNTGTCMAGTCEVGNPCDGVICDDTMNECTIGVCNSQTGMCEVMNVMDGTACLDNTGTCMAGTCEVGNLCDGVICDDTMNECTVGVCNGQTGMCEVMNVMDGTACLDNTGTCMAGTCEVTDLCQGVTCTDNGIDCVTDVCNSANGMCEPTNDPSGTTCSGGTCDGAGNCVASVSCPPDPVVGQVPTACRNSFNQALSTFPVDMDIALDDCAFAGQTFNANVTPTLNLDTSFLNAAADTLCVLGITLTQADLNAVQVRVDALTGATCTSQLSVLSPVPQTVMLDVTITGVCGAGGSVVVNSGVSVPLPPVTVPCTAGTAPGPVGFCATGTTPDNVLGADPPVDSYVTVFVSPFAVNFACGDGTVNDNGTPDNTGDDFVQALDPATDCLTFPVEP